MKIVTFACDVYSDVAPAYQYLLRKFWPDCPYEIVYVTNSEHLEVDGRVYYIRGKDIQFAWRLKRYVADCHDKEPLLLMMIDYLVMEADTRMIQLAERLCKLDDVKHVRLRPMPRPQLEYPEPGIGMIEKPSRYSLSLQPGIWDPRTLARLCRNDNWDAHDVEIQGSCLTGNVKGKLLCTEETALSHINYYKRGKVPEQWSNWVAENAHKRVWPDAVRRRHE